MKLKNVTVTLIIISHSCLSVWSQSKLYKLDEVVVVGKSLAQLKREAPSAVSILDPSLLKQSLTGLNEAIDKAAGVKVSKRGGLGSQARVLVQGLDGKRIGIFVDGMPVGHADDFDLNSIPLDMIASVEVYKGIIPAKLGGDGLGGAINILMKNYRNDHLAVSYEIGSYNTHLANIHGKKNWTDKGVSLDMSGLFNYSDNNYKFVSPFQAGQIIHRDHDAYRHYGANIGIDFSKLWFERFSFGFGYDNIYDEVQGGLMNVQNNIQHAFFKSSSCQVKQGMSKSLLGDRLRIDVNSVFGYRQVNQVDTSHYAYDFDGKRFSSPSIQGEVGLLPNDSHDQYYNFNELLNINYSLEKWGTLNWNTFYQYTRKDPKDELADKYSNLPASGYASKVESLVSGLTYELPFFDERLVNELGGRLFYYRSEVLPSAEKTYLQDKLEVIEQQGVNWGWSDAVAFHFNSNLTIKGSVQSSVRIPTSNEMFGDGVYLYPSVNLKPEKALNFNLGLSAIINPLSYPSFRIDVNTFYMKIDDMIKLMYGNMSMVYDNIGHVEVKGVDAEINATLLSCLRAKANISYQKAIDMRKDAVGGGANFHYKWRLPNTPYLFGNASFVFEKNDLFLSNLSSSIHLDMEYTHRFSYAWEASGRNDMIVPEKVNYNVGLQQSLGRHCQIGFEIRNILNKENWAEYRYPLPKRTFHLKLKYIL